MSKQPNPQPAPAPPSVGDVLTKKIKDASKERLTPPPRRNFIDPVLIRVGVLIRPPNLSTTNPQRGKQASR